MIKVYNKEIFRIVVGIMIMILIIIPAMANDKRMTIPEMQLSATDPDDRNIASGQTVKGTIDPIGDLDVFKFYGKTDQTVVIEMSPTVSGPKIDLYGPNAILEASCLFNPPYYTCRRMSQELKQTGVYTIITSALSIGTYNLSLAIIQGASSSPQDTDGGDILSQQTYKGNISVFGDTDIFVFYGKKDEGVVINMVADNSSLYPLLALYNSSGFEKNAICAGSFPSHTCILENYILKQTGIYTIITSGRPNWYGPTGKYQLSFVKIPSTTHGINNINPPDKSTVTDLNQYFKWGIEAGTTAKYDIYFGEDIITPLNKIGNNITLRELKFPTMQYGKTYYWHVEAKTPTGTIQGPYWWFTTKNPVGCAISTIYGHKFNDTNSNKTRDAGEAGISDWVMNLKGYDTCTGKLVSRTTTTNATGYYRFSTVNPGTYIVYEDFVLGWLPTTSAAYTVTVPSISTSIKRDFGNKK